MWKEGQRRNRPKVGGGDEPERESSENKNRAPTYGAKAETDCSSGASLTPRGVTALPWTGDPLLSLLAIFHRSWKWDPAPPASQSVAIALTLPQVSRELQLLLPSLFSASAHANTESCQNRYTPEYKNCNWQGPCDS